MPVLGGGEVAVVDGSTRIHAITDPSYPQVLVLPAFDTRLSDVIDPWLKAWAKDPETLIVGALTYSGTLLTSAAVVWPDGTPGTLTIVSRDSVSQRAKSWTITRGPLTYTQPAITFNGSGDPTAIPAITVA